MARKIEVQIVGDASSFHKALSQATNSSSKFGSVLGGAVRAGAYAAAAGLTAFGVAAKIGWDEFNQAQKVAAQTNAVIKSTGGAANVTAKHVEQLGTQLLNLSGVDDEVVKSGENILLTFRNIQNTKTQKTFDQATKAALDLSVAMGEDMHSAAIQVGKALNDPVKGLTALKRVGVQFTDAQTNLIKKLVETGHTAQAQKIILGELHKEFGGSAKAAGQTLGGQLDILKEKFKNAAGEIIGGLMPSIIKLANFGLPLIVSGMDAVVGEVKKVVQWFGKLNAIGSNSEGTTAKISGAWNQVVDIFNAHVLPTIRRLATIYRDAVKNIAKVLEQHRPELERIWTRISAVVKVLATVIKVAGQIFLNVYLPILRFALTKLLPRYIGIAIDIIDKLSYAISKVVDAVKWIGSHAKTAFNTLKSAVTTVAGAIETALAPIVNFLTSVVDKIQWILDHLPSIPNIGGGGSNAPFGPGSHGGTARPSVVTAGGNIVIHTHVMLGQREVGLAIQTLDKDYRRQNGRSLLA